MGGEGVMELELRLVVAQFVFCAVPRTLPSHPLSVVVRGSQWGALGGCAALVLFPACPPLVRAGCMAGVGVRGSAGVRHIFRVGVCVPGPAASVASAPLAGREARAGAAGVVKWSRGGAQTGRGWHARGKHVASINT